MAGGGCGNVGSKESREFTKVMKGEKDKSREGVFYSFFVDTEYKDGKEGGQIILFFFLTRKKGGRWKGNKPMTENGRERVLDESYSLTPIPRKTPT